MTASGTPAGPAGMVRVRVEVEDLADGRILASSNSTQSREAAAGILLQSGYLAEFVVRFLEQASGPREQ